MDFPQMPQPGQQPAPAGMPVSDEQKQELLGMIQKIKDKLAPLSAVRFASNNKTEQFRKDMLKQVFEKLQLAGVDLSNKDSVAEFIASLKENNPELAQMFEESMDVLLGSGEVNSFGEPQDPNAMLDIPGANMNNTNQNEILPQNV